MGVLRVMFSCGVLLVLSSMAATAQSVQTDYDRSFRLAGLNTYGFLERVRPPGDTLAESPLNDRRIRAALETELQAHGLSPSEQPDFWIVYDVTTKAGLNIQDNRLGLGPWDRWDSINVKQVTEGTLVVTFVDRETRHDVWRGLASRTINQKNLDKDVNKSVAKLVQQFVKDQAGRR